MCIRDRLAACLVKYNGQVFVNMIPMSGSCESLSDFWNCLNNGNMNAETAEATLIANGFALDECGRLGLKIFADFGRLTLEGGDQ